ncbi:hypothetical protein BT93_G0975 [Corymbia citriodora subsp. variegata]|nr:hypothetical protein BT93_G0975 [Corymbia citriodora subsp. variegata]
MVTAFIGRVLPLLHRHTNDSGGNNKLLSWQSLAVLSSFATYFGQGEAPWLVSTSTMIVKLDDHEGDGGELELTNKEMAS